MELPKPEHLKTALHRIKHAEYDLPLEHGEDSRFLILLVALMSFLAILSFTGTFALNGMTSRWSSGLENKITIEIPLESSDDILLSRDTVQKEATKIAQTLKKHPNVSKIEILSDEDMSALIEPWLGKDFNLIDIPMPALISVELKISNTETLKSFEEDIENMSTFAVVQTHQDWLNDLIRFARNLKILAIAIALTVATATIAAIAAAIRARFTIHLKDVELLHLMGASDEYITRQFQRHAVLLTLRGSIFGTAAGIFVTLIIIVLSGYSGTSLIPKIVISISEFLILCLLPALACVIAWVTSRVTVLQTLSKMP